MTIRTIASPKITIWFGIPLPSVELQHLVDAHERVPAPLKCFDQRVEQHEHLVLPLRPEVQQEDEAADAVRVLPLLLEVVFVDLLRLREAILALCGAVAVR